MGTDSSCGRRGLGLVLAWLMALLLSLGATYAAAGTEALGGHQLCHAVSTAVAAEEPLPEFFCSGRPSGYQKGSLWLRAELGNDPLARGEPALLVHNARFDALQAAFTYADGHILDQHVRSADFGRHWRIGGQIAFFAPQREAPVTAVTLRFDRLGSVSSLRMRLTDRNRAEQQSNVVAVLTGAALMLLLVSAIYNASLSIVTRRQFSAWQAAWAGCMLVWGLCWSHLLLIVFPSIAGPLSAQVCTSMACFAIMMATLTALTAIDREDLHPLLRRITIVLGCANGILGVPISIMRTGAADAALADVQGILGLAVLLSVLLCLIQAWHVGSRQARHVVYAWAVPLLVLGGTGLVDTGDWFWGGGTQLLILLAAAWQTLWLSISASNAYSQLRRQRDVARRAEAQAQEQARRDPLTGLRNRRGFFELAKTHLEEGAGKPAALMLIDVDRFKTINDDYGHDAGDAVLVAIAKRIARWEGQFCVAARIGGEEFAMMVRGLEGVALSRFAESLRREIAACDHEHVMADRRVTVSIGIAEVGRSAQVDADAIGTLFRRADAALYAAKRAGRDRVVLEEADAALPAERRLRGS